MDEAIVIDPRFHGPPDSSNGGYACGRLAAHVDAEAVEVTLRRPPPLARPLRVERRDGGAALLDGDEIVAEARPATLDVEAPSPVGAAEAADASTRFPYLLEGHAFPGCFGCGPARRPGDGLRIFAGPVAGREDVYAGPWVPDPSLAGPDGAVPSEFVWTALDCSGGCRVANPRSTPPVVLARLTARLDGPVEAGAEHVVAAWAIDVDGRKRQAGTAIFGADGRPRGLARSLWIELREQPAAGTPAGASG